ncbi:receptor-like serine/threonine-protein kinase At4g25390 isoform X8 [Actinidia eriantha]|uniref:receptor-like serine/threonine-protein kinase At4g25390 isoform X8 n=1 Tax=Actinidia eriantha TaxID=165200 RepID=UPI002589A746|nr:receptor-like serine/threonine-protein kinase At4g25390 isoform X8 [Actinidia eriantha]
MGTLWRLFYLRIRELSNKEGFVPIKVRSADGEREQVGKLRDGREVAVKQFYEHSYKRMKQFMNEIEILTYLRRPNIVTLYGCTSRKSQELLLVYEYIPNGDRAKDGSVSWPIRMNIAIETASALAYLHASDIIHRDVKTNNTLLDKNFCVKVADFGLSRLFPVENVYIVCDDMRQSRGIIVNLVVQALVPGFKNRLLGFTCCRPLQYLNDQMAADMLLSASLPPSPKTMALSSQSPGTGFKPQTVSNAPAPEIVVPSSTSSGVAVPKGARTADSLDCDWSEHTCPDGYMYYYNCATCESRWEKPEEYFLSEQQLPPRRNNNNNNNNILLVNRRNAACQTHWFFLPKKFLKHNRCSIRHNSPVQNRNSRPLHLLVVFHIVFNFFWFQCFFSIYLIITLVILMLAVR